MTMLPQTRIDLEKRITTILSGVESLNVDEIYRKRITAATFQRDDFEYVLADMVKRGDVERFIREKEVRYRLRRQRVY